MRIKKSFTIVAGVFILSGYLYFMNETAKLKYDLKIALTTVASLNGERDFLRKNHELATEMTGLEAPDILCSDMRTKDVILSELVKTKPLLIYRFADVNCHTCNKSGLDTVYLDDFTVTLSFSRTAQDFWTFKRMNRVKTLYSVPFNAFDWPAEKLNRPYYFVLHPDMRVSHVYIPDSQYPEANRKYFETVSGLLSK